MISALKRHVVNIKSNLKAFLKMGKYNFISQLEQWYFMKNNMSLTSDNTNNPFICLSDDHGDDSVTAPEDISAFTSGKSSRCFLVHLLLFLSPTSVSVVLCVLCFTSLRILLWQRNRRTAPVSPNSKTANTVLILAVFCTPTLQGEPCLTQWSGEWTWLAIGLWLQACFSLVLLSLDFLRASVHAIMNKNPLLQLSSVLRPPKLLKAIWRFMLFIFAGLVRRRLGALLQSCLHVSGWLFEACFLPLEKQNYLSVISFFIILVIFTKLIICFSFSQSAPFPLCVQQRTPGTMPRTVYQYI